MSKVIYVCFKDPSRCNSDMVGKIETIAQKIIPDNITPRKPKIVINHNIIYGIVNPASSIEEVGGSILLGMAFGAKDKWWEPGELVPDGSFSIFRSNGHKTEILTDVVGSRTIWYYHDEEVFIASSSQRAIINLLGSFEFNPKVIPWMLSTGSLGPELSWDRRIKFLPSDSLAELDHSSWSLQLKVNNVKFESADISEKEHETAVMSALTDTFKSLDVDFSKWVLPLSGGFDSRGILSLFHFVGTSVSKVRSITWGLKNSANQPGNDAYIAKKLANFYKIDHKYYPTDLSSEPLENVFHRFLVCGEGRVDHIGGYTDGFQIWKTLFEDEIQGIIRGDEGFGRLPVHSPLKVRTHVEVALCADYPNLNGFEELGISSQTYPKNLERKEDETLETWRDRLYHQYRMPVVLAALSDLKLPYVEIISPLLSSKILVQARRIPDDLRTDKLLFKRIVRSISPDIDYATSSAIAEARFILKSRAAVDLFRTELLSSNCKSILPQHFIAYILDNLKVVEGTVNKKQILKSFLKRFLPKSLINKGTRLTASKEVSVNTLAFRTYIICKMNNILNEDTQTAKQATSTEN